MKKQPLLLLLPLLLFVGCAVYKYVPSYNNDRGYRDGALSDDTFFVEYQFNFLITKKWQKDFGEKYALLRSAELTKKNRFKYFVVLNKRYGVIRKSVGGSLYGYGYRFEIQCYKEKPTYSFPVKIYQAEMVIKNYKYLYNSEKSKERAFRL